MWIFLLAAAAAVVFWASCVFRERRGGQRAEETAASAPPVRERLEDSRTVERLGEVVDELRTVMGHPRLGGPGYLSIRFPQQGQEGDFPAVSCQYPNISEELYRKIVRQDLETGALVEAGIPEGLFSRGLTFAAESGGVVVLTAEVYGLAPEVEDVMAGRGRGEALRVLAGALGRRYPGDIVQALAGEIILTPRQPDRLASEDGANP